VPKLMRIRNCMLFLAMLSAGCATRLPASYYPREETYAFEDTSNTPLGRVYEKASQNHPGLSGFHLLPTGPEALMMRIALIESSQRSIDMQYFSTQDDTTGKLLLEAISRAADRGVRVRMLLDDWSLDDFEAGAVSLNAHPNIEIRVFNPYSTRDESFFAHFGNVFSDMDQFTRRMHNKAIIVDNQISIMGGRNLGDEYFDASADVNFRDIDIFSAGPITRQISKNFDIYWNSDQSFPISTLKLPPPDPQTITKLQEDRVLHWQQLITSPLGKRLIKMPLPQEVKKGDVPLIWAKAELVADIPGKIDLPTDATVSAPGVGIDEMAKKAQHEFIIFTPYFVPLDGGVEWLKQLVDRGVSVRIVTNSLSSTDMVPAQAAYSHYRQALVEDGVELYEIKSSQPHGSIKGMFKPSSLHGLHAKIYMVDRRELAVGSFNFDARSLRSNTEQILIIHSPELCGEIGKLFKQVTLPTDSYHVVLKSSESDADQSQSQDESLVWLTEENGVTVSYDFTPHAGFWRNLTDNLFSILPIDDEL